MERDLLHIPNDELEYSYARSSGPGGQNVNKVNSKVVLRWNLWKSAAIGSEAKGRFFERYQNKINEAGFVVLSSDEHRDQPRNRANCYDKLIAMIRTIQKPPKKRKKTKPTRSSQKKRLDSKKRHSEKKSTRSKLF